MNWKILANSTLVENLGWTLVHSVWQIALVAFILFLLLRVLHKFSANARYLVSVFALVFAIILPVLTFVNLNGNLSANLSKNEFSAQRDFQLNNPNLRPDENFPALTEAQRQAAAAKNENVFGSIENLQNFFDKNFSASLPFVVVVWLFGVALFAARLAGGVWQLHRYKTREISRGNRRLAGKIFRPLREVENHANSQTSTIESGQNADCRRLAQTLDSDSVERLFADQSAAARNRYRARARAYSPL